MAKGSLANNIFAKPAAVAETAAASPAAEVAGETAEQTIARLRAELAAAQSKAGSFQVGMITVNVTSGHKYIRDGKEHTATTGRISMLGLQRNPLTFGIAQFEKLRDVLADKTPVHIRGQMKDGKPLMMKWSEFVAMADDAGVLDRK